ncbi:c-type cytochrome [Methylonatrum kenyense]|uniref:c-type cytochrome n=1 Tax=Methylonatrum kenyense TaxID=455253 RepID=UPI0020BF2CFE|nr:c-type cytochrome [Methylonatrum kenyense]MCK8515414.1 c-type cytochrome [Methylonatrum kenyense]
MKSDTNALRSSGMRFWLVLLIAMVGGAMVLTGCGDSSVEQEEVVEELDDVEDAANNDDEALSEEADTEELDEAAEIDAETEADRDLYTVVCETDADGRRVSCAVDQDTFIGWRSVGSNCAVCHGQEAAGSSFAPNLIRRVNEISEEQFFEVLKNGVQTEGSAMPGFGDNPNVWPRREAIYAYLKARANGDLPAGRPERLQD